MSKWFEQSRIYGVRNAIEKKLELPPYRGDDETAAEFWARAEKAGLLEKALALYDETDAHWAAWEQMRRETKQEFAARIEREGRTEEAQRVRAQLSKAGHTERQI